MTFGIGISTEFIVQVHATIDSMAPHSLWTVRKKAEVQLWTDDDWNNNIHY